MVTLIITWIMGASITVTTIPFEDMAACKRSSDFYLGQVANSGLPDLLKAFREHHANILVQCSPAATVKLGKPA